VTQYLRLWEFVLVQNRLSGINLKYWVTEKLSGKVIQIWPFENRNFLRYILKRPLKNANFCSSSRKAIILTTGIQLSISRIKI